MNEEWYSQLAESIAENKSDAVTNLIADPYFDEVLKDIVKCQNLLRIAGVEHNHNSILNLLLEKMSTHEHIAADIVEDVCEKGHLDVVKSLLNANAFDANAIRTRPTLLSKACLSDNTDLVAFLIDNGAQPSWLALHVACKAGALDTVKLLIEKGVTLSGFHSDYRSLFASAIQSNRIEVLDYLLQHYKDKLDYLVELFPFICEMDNPDILKVFIDNGLDVLSKNEVTSYGRQTSYLEKMLIGICRKGSIALLDNVIHRKKEDKEDNVVNMPLREYGTTTPLHIASSSGNVDLFEQLLAHGANICAVDSHKHTPLFNACYYNKPAIVERLLVYGSKNNAFKVNAVDEANNTALHYALKSEAPDADIIRMIHLLVMHGADIKINSPLIDAIRCCSLDIIEVLLNLDPDLNQKDSSGGLTALLQAIIGASVGRSAPQIVRRLLEVGADPNTANDFGFTPLMRAAQLNNKELVTVLLQQGSIDSSKRSRYGYSAADMTRSPEIRNLINQHIKRSQEDALCQNSSSSSRPPF